MKWIVEAGRLQQSNHLEKHRENRLLLGVKSAWEKGSSDLCQAVLGTDLPCSSAAGCSAGNLPGQVLTEEPVTWVQLNTTLLQAISNLNNDNIYNNVETCLPKPCLWTPMGIAREYIKLLMQTWTHSRRVKPAAVNVQQPEFLFQLKPGRFWQWVSHTVPLLLR